MKILSSDKLQEMTFPLFSSGPKISGKADFGITKREFYANRLSFRSLYDGKVESELKGYGSDFFFLDNFDLGRVEVEIGELFFEHEGI